MTKTCSRCGQAKALEGFAPDRRMRDGYRGVCRDCRNAGRRADSPLAEQHRLAKDGLKRCKGCSEILPISSFQSYRRVGREAPGRSTMCVECRNASRRGDFEAKDRLAAQKRQRWQADPAYRDRQRSAGLKRRYGIGLDDMSALLDEQGGVCGICGEDDPKGRNWHVDHDHATGRVRGILCGPCNVSLGGFQDDPDRLIAAAMYLLADVDVLREVL